MLARSPGENRRIKAKEKNAATTSNNCGHCVQVIYSQWGYKQPYKPDRTNFSPIQFQLKESFYYCFIPLLIGVGIETLQKGQFPSLAYYLLFSSAAVSFCEGAFFIHMFLAHCIRWQSEPRLYVCLRKTARMGGFQKFLGYGILSIACFLHPVLVWHVTIPGTMLIVTGLAYLFLSKRKKTKSKVCVLQAEYYTDPSTTAIAMTRAGDTEQTYTFNGSLREKKESLLTQMRSILKVKKDRHPSKTTDQGHVDTSIDSSAKKKQVHFEEKVIKIIPLEEGILEEQDNEHEVTISDTIPIIPTELKQVPNTLPMASGIF